MMQKLYSTWYTDCTASPTLYQSRSRKASFFTPILHVREADRNNISQLTEPEMRTELPHCNPAPYLSHHYPCQLLLLAPEPNPFLWGDPSWFPPPDLHLRLALSLQYAPTQTALNQH